MPVRTSNSVLAVPAPMEGTVSRPVEQVSFRLLNTGVGSLSLLTLFRRPTSMKDSS